MAIARSLIHCCSCAAFRSAHMQPLHYFEMPIRCGLIHRLCRAPQRSIGVFSLAIRKRASRKGRQLQSLEILQNLQAATLGSFIHHTEFRQSFRAGQMVKQPLQHFKRLSAAYCVKQDCLRVILNEEALLIKVLQEINVGWGLFEYQGRKLDAVFIFPHVFAKADPGWMRCQPLKRFQLPLLACLIQSFTPTLTPIGAVRRFVLLGNPLHERHIFTRVWPIRRPTCHAADSHSPPSTRSSRARWKTQHSQEGSFQGEARSSPAPSHIWPQRLRLPPQACPRSSVGNVHVATVPHQEDKDEQN